MKINYKLFTSILLFGTLLPVLIGVGIYGLKVFDVGNPIFQFVSYGFIASLAFALFAFQKYILSFIAQTGLFVGLYFLTGNQFLMTHLFYDGAVLITVFIYSLLIFDHLKTAPYMRPLILAAILSIFFVSNTFILSLIHSVAITSVLIFKNMLVGLLIGLGVGGGIEVSIKMVEKDN